MAKLPSKDNLSGPASLRSGRMISSADMSGAFQGLRSLGNSLTGIGAERAREDNAVDVARAEAMKTEGLLAAQNAFDQDGDYSTFQTRAPQKTKAVVDQAAALIRDPSMRERWAAGAQGDAARINDTIFDKASGLRKQANTNALDEALEANRRIYVDPATSEEDKKKARADIEGAIGVAGDIGLLTPDQAQARKDLFINGADVNRAMLEAQTNPGAFIGGASVGFGNPNLPAGMRNNNPGNIKFVGQGRDRGVIGPSQNTDQGDPQAVFTTPEQGMREAYRLARSKYDGGKTTANELIAGNGGWTPGNTQAAANIAATMGVGPDDDLNLADPASAQKFLRALVKQEHGSASDAYSDSMIAGAVAGGAVEDLPIVTKGASVTGRSFDPDLKGIKPDVISRFKQLQNSVGKSIPVVSGFRDVNRNKRAGGAKSSQHIHGNALDLDVSGMSQDERVALIKQARANGFSGIGVYANSIHIDTGPSRAWGASHGSESLPAWAREAVNSPVGNAAGQGAQQPATPGYFANLSPEDRYKVQKAAEAEQNRRSVEMRSGIDVIVANAPTAILNTGQYSGQMPGPEQFFAAYGPQEGAERYNQFQSSIQTAEQAHGMRTMSSDQIEAMVNEATPTSSGNDAVLQSQRYETLSKAAAATLKAREEDPATYARTAFPGVAKAWEGATTPAGFQSAIAASVAAQQQMGVTKIAPLPKEFADKAVTTFKDTNLGEVERLAAVSDIFLATPDPDQRKAIFEQMVDAGLPDVTDGAFVALDRGDTGAAKRLFQAAMTDISKLPGQAPFKPAEIDEAIERLIMADEQIGDIYYGMADGAIENTERAQRDSKLLANAVNIRVRNGEPLDAAVSSVAKDLYGDVKPVLGDGRTGAQILIPKDVDEAKVMDGLTGLMPAIEERLREALTVPGDAPAADGTKAIMNAAGQNEVNALLNEGYFRNIANGYMFFLPRLGAVAGDDGEPLIFTMDDILAAGVKKPRDVRSPEAPLTDDDFDAFQKRMQQ